MTEAQLLDGQAFNRLVLENDLAGKTWEQDGYVYCGFRGKDGYELYRAYGPKWRYLYQARRVCTQNAGGGGALTVRISMPSGVIGELEQMEVAGAASAGASLVVGVLDEDAAGTYYLASIAAGATRTARLPSIGSAATAHANIVESLRLKLGPGQYLYSTTSAALQTETLTVAITLLLSTNIEPIWDTTGSAGTPALAASTISAANTMQAVMLP